MLISIIVPVFNASMYVAQCIESVLNQTYTDFELILINDGSTDNSLEICQSYSFDENRIKILDKQNEGVSPSRNIGIEKSSGSWVMFLDADDWLEPHCLSTCIEKVNAKDVDLLCFNHYYNKGSFEWKMEPLTERFISCENDELRHFKLDMMYPHFDLVKNKVQVGSIRAVWGKLFNARIIKDNKLLFNTGFNISEDAIFCLEFANHSKAVALVNSYLMHYRVHGESLTNNYNHNINTINQEIMQVFYEKFRQAVASQEFQICYAGIGLECLFRALRVNLIHKNNKVSINTKLKEISALLQNDYFKKAFICKEFGYFPLGKRELLFFAQRKSSLGVYFVSKVSVFVLAVQNYLKSTNNY